MKSNIIPFGVIAIIGIFAVVIFSSLGVSQRADIENEGENGGNGEETEEVAEVAEPEEVFQNNCASCHGDDLSGGAGPDLTSDRKSTRLNSSHVANSYAVFCM